MAARIGFLHTSPAHVTTFTALAGPDAVHVVDESLLASPDPVRVRDRLAEVAAGGADVIVCTCSTIGGLAETAAGDVGVQVVRVDRPMAEAAVAIGGRIGLVAALASTLGPSRTLLEEAGATDVVDLPCLDAWPLFERGDLDGYHRRIAEHLVEVAPSVDVVVLAQASMAPAADLVDVGVPVLSSPRSAVDYAKTSRNSSSPSSPTSAGPNDGFGIP